MAQVLVFRKPRGHGWLASVLMPSLDPKSKVRNAIVYVAAAVDIQTRQDVDIRALGTGQDAPPMTEQEWLDQQAVRRIQHGRITHLAGVPINL